MKLTRLFKQSILLDGICHWFDLALDLTFPSDFSQTKKCSCPKGPKKILKKLLFLFNSANLDVLFGLKVDLN